MFGITKSEWNPKTTVSSQLSVDIRTCRFDVPGSLWAQRQQFEPVSRAKKTGDAPEGATSCELGKYHPMRR